MKVQTAETRKKCWNGICFNKGLFKIRVEETCPSALEVKKMELGEFQP